MNILLRTILFSICIAFVSVCAAQVDEPRSTIQKIMDKGEIVVGMTGTQPPLSIRAKTGELIGYEVDLAKLLASSLGVELKIKEMPFAKLLPSVKSKQVDIAMSGITISTERNTKVAFYGPYLVGGKSLLTKSAILSTITNPEELNSDRYILTTLKGSTGELYLKNLAPKAKVILADNYESAVTLVRENKANAMLADYSVCAYNYFLYANEGFFLLKSPLTIEPIGVAMAPDDPHFMNVIENFFQYMELTGALKRLEAKWYNSGDWVSLVK